MKRRKKIKWYPIDYGLISNSEIKCSICKSSSIVYGYISHSTPLTYRCSDCGK